ncbi:MAG: zinc-ribbon domain-containing protein [Nitrospinae bacterium]|nr:zinc-ribbon domain-containing protein [Nitrospinota bacterium]
MLLTCPKCSTKYQVDSESIADSGTYAHCASCENIFFVKKKKKIASNQTQPMVNKTAPVQSAPVVETAKKIEEQPAPEEPAAQVIVTTPLQTPSEQGHLDAIFNALNEKPTKTTTAQDDIDALFGNVATEIKTGKQAPEQKVSKPEPAAVLKPASTQDDLDAIFSSAANIEPIVAIGGQDDIDALFGNVTKTPEPPKPVVEKKPVSQLDEMDAIFNAVAKTPEPPKPVVEQKPAPAIAGQDDIDALFGGSAKTETPAIAGQDDIDALFGGSAKTETPAIAGQDDIDALFGGSAKTETPAIAGQDDIDALLNGFATNDSDKPTAPAAITGESVEGLMAVTGANQPPEKAEEKNPSDALISQDDLNALFAEASVDKPAGGSAPAATPEISQDDLNALFATEAAPAVGEASADTSSANIQDLFKEEATDTSQLFESEAFQAQAPANGKSPEKAQQTPAPEPSGKAAEEAEQHAEETEKVKKRALIRLPKLSRRQKIAAFSLAASLALIVFGARHNLDIARLITAKKGHITTALKATPKPEKRLAEVKPPAPAAPEKKEAEKPVKPTEEAKHEEPVKPEAPKVAEKTEPVEKKTEEASAKPPAKEEAAAPPPEKKEEPPAKTETPKEGLKHEKPIELAKKEERLVTPKPVVQNKNLNFGIIVPVDYNAQQVKVMTADVEITFASGKDLTTAEKKQFLYEMTIEKEIEGFFRDKFYSDTHYAQDKLVAHLTERMKRRGDLEKITSINIQNFSVK